MTDIDRQDEQEEVSIFDEETRLEWQEMLAGFEQDQWPVFRNFLGLDEEVVALATGQGSALRKLAVQGLKIRCLAIWLANERWKTLDELATTLAVQTGLTADLLSFTRGDAFEMMDEEDEDEDDGEGWKG